MAVLRPTVTKPDTGNGAAPVHRAQHLNVGQRVEAEAPWDTGLHQFDDAPGGGLRVVGHREMEVAVALLPAEIGDDPPVDGVGGGDDPTSRRLPEYLREPRHWNAVRK